MKLWNTLNPKIKAALLTAAAVGIVAVVNAIYNLYPNNALVGILYTLAPVIAGYLKAETKASA